MNSKLYKFYFSIVGEKTAGWCICFSKKTTIEKFLIPNDISKVEKLTEIVELILKENSLEMKDKFEDDINKLVYGLYDLTENEIKIVERSQRIKPYTFAIRTSQRYTKNCKRVCL